MAVVAYEVYRLSRIWVTGTETAARRHAIQIVRAERVLHLYVERSAQRALTGRGGILSFWNVYYGTIHFVVPVAVLVWLWRRAPARYRQWRTIFGLMLAIAIGGFAFYPLLPPRLLPAHYGFVDTAARYGGLGSLGGPDKNPGNPYAAMPSLHIGWSTWCALALIPVLRRRWSRLLIAAYPVATLIAIVVTGNHYVLDAVGGVVVLGLAWWIEALIAGHRPDQEAAIRPRGPVRAMTK